MRPPTKDYYRILGVLENADEAQVKKAYRKLAVEFHPDRNPGNAEAEEKFKDLTEAYGVLMDPKKRREYDGFKNAFGGGGPGGGSGFNYSQQEIFENMFRQAFGRDAFNDLNSTFRSYGYRSGTGFFDSILFGGVGAMGTLGRLLSMIPGPIGRVGLGLRALQGLGASLLALKQMRDANRARQGTGGAPSKPSLLGKVKKFFIPGATGDSPANLDLHFEITIAPHEALQGTQKQVSYQVNGKQEQLRVRIPPRVISGQKLRIREKGKHRDDQRGDVILTILVAAA